jgi:hypothetical protein
MSLMSVLRSFRNDLQLLLFAGSSVLQLACANHAAPSNGPGASTDNAATASGSAASAAPSSSTSTAIGSAAGGGAAGASSVASSAALGGRQSAADSGGSGGAVMGAGTAGTNAAALSRDAGASAAPRPDLGDDAGPQGPSAPVAVDAGLLAECATEFAACVEEGPLKVDECLETFSGCKAFADGGIAISLMCATSMAACVLRSPTSASQCVSEFLRCEL